MRRRTPSEIKAYGDGYAEAYKEFCHLLKNHDVDKAVRKMKIFVDAVVLTVETATDEPYEYEIKALHKDHIEPYVIIEDDQTDCPWK